MISLKTSQPSRYAMLMGVTTAHNRNPNIMRMHSRNQDKCMINLNLGSFSPSDRIKPNTERALAPIITASMIITMVLRRLEYFLLDSKLVPTLLRSDDTALLKFCTGVVAEVIEFLMESELC